MKIFIKFSLKFKKAGRLSLFLDKTNFLDKEEFCIKIVYENLPNLKHTYMEFSLHNNSLQLSKSYLYL